MRTLHPFERRLATFWPPDAWQDVTVVLAISGGPDSVALLRGMAALKTAGAGRLVGAHFNHHWRGAEADDDQRFVVELCRRLELDCRTGDAAQPPASGAPEGWEAAARDDRYEFLLRTAQALGARYVATGHTADDQAETVLHHVLRGTGLAGLAGMSRVRSLGPDVTLVRPILEIKREEVIAYLTAINQPYREDHTNADTRFTRNRIRHELVPLLAREYAPGVVDSLVRLAAVAGDAQRLIEWMAEKLCDRVVDHANESRVTVDCQALSGQDRHLVREVLIAVWRRQGWPMRAMGFAEWNRLAEMVAASVECKHVFPGAVTAERTGEQLVLTPTDRGHQSEQ
jgi:tRNA(Ile)-lysidine synthase